MGDIVKRPKDSNADAWHLFLSEYLDNRASFPNGMPFMAVQIAEALDEFKAAEITRLRSAVRELREALEPFYVAERTMQRSLGTTQDDLLYGVYARDLRRARSALLSTPPFSTRTAPGAKAMTDDELVEKMARELFYTEYDRETYSWDSVFGDERELYLRLARSALSIANPILRNEALEEAAKVADHLNGWGSDCGKGGHSEHIARAIRSLKTGDAE